MHPDVECAGCYVWKFKFGSIALCVHRHCALAEIPGDANLACTNMILCFTRCWPSRTSSPPSVATCTNIAPSPAASSPTHGSPASSHLMAALCSTTRARRTPHFTPGDMWMSRWVYIPRVICMLDMWHPCIYDNFIYSFNFLCNPLYAKSCHHIHMMLRTVGPMS